VQVSAPVEQRSEQEIFYSCPSTSAELFFEAVSNQLAGLETSAYADTASTQLEQALELAQAVQVCPWLLSTQRNVQIYYPTAKHQLAKSSPTLPVCALHQLWKVTSLSWLLQS